MGEGDQDIVEALARQNRALAALSSSGLPSGADTADAFRALTETAAETLQVGRVSVWLFDDSRGDARGDARGDGRGDARGDARSKLTCADLFTAADGAHADGAELLACDYPAYFAALRDERTIEAADAETHPQTCEFRDGYLRPLGIGAMLDASIRVGGEPVGVVCHEHLGGPRPWRQDEVAFAGSLAGLAALVIEQRQRFLAEQALSERERELRQALAAARMGTWHWDIVADVLRWSDETGPLFGQPPGYVPASFEAYAALLHPEDLDLIKAAIARALEEPGVRYHVEHRVLLPDGGVGWIEGRGTVVRSASGEPLAMTGTVADITARRRLEEDLRQAQKMDAIGHLAGGVAHDFNNLLTVISGQAELARLSLGDAAAEEMDDIIAASARAAALTRQLLAFARKQAIRPTVQDARTLVGDLGRMLRRLIGDHIELRMDMPPDACPIRADAAQVEQVVVNLAVNARDAMAGGGTLTITLKPRTLSLIEATRVREIEPGRYVQLSVSDTGSGIAPEVVDRIFDPFFTTKEVGQGTGLGLSTCYGIVRQAGGVILVDSRPGAGSRFDVLLPFVEATPRAHNAPLSVREAQAAEATILVVEDAPMVRKLTTRFLESAGYALRVAADGAEALEFARRAEAPIDLMLLDVVLPGLRGEELVARVRQHHPHVRVLFVSGYAEGTITEQGVVTEGVRLLPKPFNRAELLEQVQQTLRAPAPDVPAQPAEPAQPVELAEPANSPARSAE